MRATLDTLLLASWAGLAICGAAWVVLTAVPESELLGQHGELLGRLLVTGFPLLSAWRVQHNYHISMGWLWFLGLWLFSLAFLVTQGQTQQLQQTALILGSLLFIALPVPMARVWNEMRAVLGRTNRLAARK